MTEKRLTARLIAYWERLRGEAALPAIERFNEGTVPDLWPFCYRLSLQPTQGGLTGYRYEYLGKKVIEIFGRDMTGQSVTSMVHNLPGSAILKQIDPILHDPSTREEGGQFINTRSRIVKYRSCLLPFGNERVTHVIVGLSWREF